MLRTLLSFPRASLDAWFEEPKLKAMMALWGMHLDFAPSIANGAVFPWLESMGGRLSDWALGASGADSLSRAMRIQIEESGGMVEIGAEVARIETTGGRATGVTLADGRQIAARRAVVTVVRPAALMQKTGPAGDPACGS